MQLKLTCNGSGQKYLLQTKDEIATVVSILK